MNRRTVILAALVTVLGLLQRPAAGTGMEFHSMTGLGFDWETAEDSPLRCLAGLGLSRGPLALTLALDAGLPWEPSVVLDAALTLAQLDLLRLEAAGAAWARAIGGTAWETGMRIGPRMELGPRFLSLAAAGGWTVQSTYYAAIGSRLGDSAPWAHLGIAWRPIDPVRLELSMASDPTGAYWLRTVFGLSGSWEPAPGCLLDVVFALHYSDFFTLTSCLDGLETRVRWRMPIGRMPS